jgi:hypothetical protein
MAHSKPVPIDSVTTVETFVAERNGFSTKVSYTVGLTLANDLGTQRMLARIYTSLPKTLVKDSFTGDILTPDPIKDLIKLTMDPAVEQIVTDIENGSTNASSSALNIRFRQIVELHKKDLPSWIQVIDPESVHITGWKFDRGELIQGK